MKVFLIGYMASGKTTIGKKLSREMDLNFIDLDSYIEEKEGRSIGEIFDEGGEALFRGVESQCLKEVIRADESVLLSTGGGTPCFYDNMSVINEAGTSIYLEMDAKSLTFRLINAKGNRPIVKGVSESELLEFISQQMEERKYYYAEADLKVNALGFNSTKVKSLAKQISNYHLKKGNT